MAEIFPFQETVWEVHWSFLLTVHRLKLNYMDILHSLEKSVFRWFTPFLKLRGSVMRGNMGKCLLGDDQHFLLHFPLLATQTFVSSPSHKTFSLPKWEPAAVYTLGPQGGELFLATRPDIDTSVHGTIL